MSWVAHAARREMRNAYIIFVKKKIEQKRPLQGPMNRWKEQAYLKETGYEGID
jgi:hypothetical protein